MDIEIIEVIFIIVFGAAVLIPLSRMPKEKRFYNEKD
jgi:hypothetical protein